MGGRGSSFLSAIRRRRGTSRIGTQTDCPLCGQKFGRSTTFNQLNNHIDECLQNAPYRPTTSPTETLKSPSEVASLAFDSKCEWLRCHNDQDRVPWQESSVTLVIQREALLEHSALQALGLSQVEWRSEFNLVFEGEMAKDAGGVLKEWLRELNSLLLSPSQNLYTFTGTDTVAYRPNPTIRLSDLYRLHGLILGKAIFEGVPLNSRLAKPIFKRIVGKPVNFEDLRDVDQAVYTALVYMRDNDITETVFESFSVEKRQESTVTVFDLKPNGRNIPVTEESKGEYIRLRADWELGKGSEHIRELVKGVHTVVQKEWLQVFEPEEVELALCGLPFIDVADWEAYTIYKGEYNPDHQVVQWFWSLLNAISQEQLSLLLQFVMGTSRLPVEGFKTLRTMRGEPACFTLEPVSYSDRSPYPRAHTCFNRLDLPVYPSQSLLRKFLLYTIANHSQGFGLE